MQLSGRVGPCLLGVAEHLAISSALGQQYDVQVVGMRTLLPSDGPSVRTLEPGSTNTLIRTIRDTYF
jgi:hypothetical protein